MLNELNLTKTIGELTQLEQEMDAISNVSSTRGLEANSHGRAARTITLNIKDTCLQKLAAIDGCLHQLADFSVQKPGNEANNPLFEQFKALDETVKRINNKWSTIVSPNASRFDQPEQKAA